MIARACLIALGLDKPWQGPAPKPATPLSFYDWWLHCWYGHDQALQKRLDRLRRQLLAYIAEATARSEALSLELEGLQFERDQRVTSVHRGHVARSAEVTLQRDQHNAGIDEAATLYERLR